MSQKNIQTESKIFSKFLNKKSENKYVNHDLWDPEKTLNQLNDPNVKIPENSMAAKFMIQLDQPNIPSFEDWQGNNRTNAFLHYRINNRPRLNTQGLKKLKNQNFKVKKIADFRIQNPQKSLFDEKQQIPLGYKPRRKNVNFENHEQYRKKYASDVVSGIMN